MIDKTDTYFLVEDLNGNLNKISINSLGNLFLVKSEDNQYIQQLINKIDELSMFILDLSSEFIKDHYSRDDLLSIFEPIDDTNALLTDRTILTENDAYKYINDAGIVTIDTVDKAYDDESTKAEKYFEKLDNESDKYF